MSKPEPLNEYEDYLLQEWNQFLADPSRANATLEAAAGLELRRVLDLGCGAGQEMLPLIRKGAFGVGLDYDAGSGPVGKRMFTPQEAAFLRGSGETLPFRDASFDVLVCRLAIPYMDNAKALAEMSRVLRPQGRLLLKIHAAPYYVRKVWTGIRNADPLFSIHALRVLAAGAVYTLTGKQAPAGLWTKEVFLSERLLKRELRKIGMEMRGTLPDTNFRTPSYVIAKL
ncbi:MAG: class I SAM-dependent methyltransferase [Acidobacteriota bacterium]